jgi:hypothetical protein
VTAAAVEGTTWRRPEEFIAPAPALAEAAATAPAAETATAETATAASGEEELMWLGDEFEEADLEVAAQGWRSPDAAPATQGAAPVLELSDAELAQLAEDEGWDADEVEAIRRLLGRPSDAPPPVPGPPAAPGQQATSDMPSPEPSREAAPPAAEDARLGDARFADAGAELPPSPDARPAGDDPDADSLEERGGAAADAYRRLRKLFPN